MIEGFPVSTHSLVEGPSIFSVGQDDKASLSSGASTGLPHGLMGIWASGHPGAISNLSAASTTTGPARRGPSDPDARTPSSETPLPRGRPTLSRGFCVGQFIGVKRIPKGGSAGLAIPPRDIRHEGSPLSLSSLCGGRVVWTVCEPLCLAVSQAPAQGSPRGKEEKPLPCAV